MITLTQTQHPISMKTLRQIQSFFAKITLLIASLAALPLAADAQTLEWGSVSVSNPGGTGSITTTDGIALNVNGGTDKNSSLVYIGTAGTYSDLNFLSSTSEGVKFTVSGLNISGNVANSQLLYFTLTPEPATLPYNEKTAFSLQLFTNGSLSMGWRADSNSKGWPSREANDGSLVKTDAISGLKFTGFELTLTSTNYELIVHTRLNGIDSTMTYSGLHGITEDWGNLGINLTLQKTNAGETTSATATIGELRVDQIPEPSTVAFLACATVLACGTPFLRSFNH